MAVNFIGAVGRAVGIVIGQSVGAKDPERGRRALRIGLVLATLLVALSAGLRMPDLAALRLPDAVVGLAFGLYGVPNMFGPHQPSVAASLAALIGYTVIGVAALHWRVRSAERAGLGGGELDVAVDVRAAPVGVLLERDQEDAVVVRALLAIREVLRQR